MNDAAKDDLEVDADGRRWVTAFVQRIQTKTILNPLLWLNGIGMPLSLLGVLATIAYPFVWVFLGVFLCLPIASLIAYTYWARRDPNRLQSEDHQYNMRQLELQLIGDDRAGASPQVIDATPVSNTEIETIGTEVGE